MARARQTAQRGGRKKPLPNKAVRKAIPLQANEQEGGLKFGTTQQDQSPRGSTVTDSSTIRPKRIIEQVRNEDSVQEIADHDAKPRQTDYRRSGEKVIPTMPEYRTSVPAMQTFAPQCFNMMQNMWSQFQNGADKMQAQTTGAHLDLNQQDFSVGQSNTNGIELDQKCMEPYTQNGLPQETVTEEKQQLFTKLLNEGDDDKANPQSSKKTKQKIAKKTAEKQIQIQDTQPQAQTANQKEFEALSQKYSEDEVSKILVIMDRFLSLHSIEEIEKILELHQFLDARLKQKQQQDIQNTQTFGQNTASLVVGLLEKTNEQHNQNMKQLLELTKSGEKQYPGPAMKRAKLK